MEGKEAPWNISASSWIPWDPLLHMVISVCGSSQKSLVDRAYTWYTVLPAGSIRTWEDMVESFCSKYFHVEEKITLVNLHGTKQQIGEDLVKYIHRFRDVSLDCHVKLEKPPFQSSLKLKRAGTRRVCRRLSLCPPATAPSGTKRKNPIDKAYEEPPPLPFTAEEMMAIFDKWVQDQVIKLPKISKQPTAEEQKNPKYCRYHRYKEQQKVHQTPFPNYNKGKGKAIVSVVIHGNVSDMEVEESAAASSSLQNLEPTCFTAEAHASRAFLETTNAITFTDEDMEVQYPDHRRPLYLSAVVKDVQKIQGSPMEVTGFGGMTEHTMGHVQLVLKVGPIMALTQFHVVNAETPYHVLLGRPWLHKHKLVSSTYHQCVKGRLNGKPIRIAANSCLFDQTEAHFVEAALYDDLASTGEPSIVRPCGTPLPAWEDIKDDPEIDLRELLERKKKRKGTQKILEKVVVDQLQSTAMSSEEVTVDHAQSTVTNPQGIVVDQTGSMAINSERPAVDQTESIVVNFKEASEDQTKSTVMGPGGSTVDHAQSTVRNSGAEAMSLSAKERKCLIDLLHEYKDVFAWDYHEMPGIDPGLVAHSLNVEPGTRPVVQPMRTFHTEVEGTNHTRSEETTSLLASLNQFSIHGGCQTLYLVKKKNGQIKCCVDFRNLNKACPKDEFPLPNMDLLIDSAAGHAMFSFMDGFSGYNQIRMSTRDAEKTAFRTPIGNFYYTVMPFGLKNVGATYQRTMTAMFHDMMHKEIEDYVDDIVVKSKRREDHLRILRKVFDRCRLYKLKMNPLKCAFGVSAGKFLGFLVHNRGIDVDPAKASAIATMKAPTSHKELKSFLGRLSYIKRFIPGLASVTAVFIPLMKKGVPFVWSTACQQAFEKIQLIMTKLPTVCAPIPGRPLRLYLASNNEAIGGLVAQEDEDWTEKPIYYVSRALRDVETRYSGAERACLALIYASQPIKSQAIADLLAQFLGEDSSSISHEVPREIGEALLAGTIKEPSYLCLALAQKLEEKFDTFEISHAMRCENRYADALSQPTLGSQVSFEGSKTAWRNLSKMMCEPPRGSKEVNRGPREVLLRIQRWDQPSSNKTQEASHKNPKPVMKEAHSGECGEHQGKKRLYQLLLTLGYYWPTMKKDTADFVKSCHTCQLQANLIHTHPTSLQNMATPWPFHTWGLDLIGPINPSSGGYIWILCGYRVLLKVAKMVFDYGKGWSSHLVDTLWAYRGSIKTATGFTPFSLVYGTDAISPTELLVPSPRILHGMDLEADADICAEARVADLEGLEEARELAQIRSLRYHQKLADAYGKTLQTRIFAKGQMVLRAMDHVRRGLPSPSKFAPNWEGPYLIREAYDSGYYRLSTADGTTLVDPINGKWLKRYYS
uniref:Reverse transcriptase domain-containing protein n=1 Tax=Fagus sylvatica TaxID=28930 RepID=A0A2N9G179_FAGSY